LEENPVNKKMLAMIIAGGSLAIAALALPRTMAQPSPGSRSVVNAPVRFQPQFTPIDQLAQAQPAPVPPPAQVQQIPIGELRQTNSIAISGQVGSIVGNDFTLEDSSGQIIVDAGPRWYREINLNEGEQVTVTGKVSPKSGEFDAFSIRRADGSVIDIRPEEGPPPWSGGARRGSAGGLPGSPRR
jgi:uncharacterized protein YdeI (BOF family)